MQWIIIVRGILVITASLMTTLRQGDRFFDFGCRTQINYPKISILIKNMPLDDMERYGRIKDVLPAMLSTANVKVNQINTLMAMANQLSETKECFVMITNALEDINRVGQQQQKEGIKIMRNMLMELDSKLPSMSLDHDQEQYILNRVDRAIDEAYDAISKASSTNAAFASVIDNLTELVSKQQLIHDQMHVVDDLSPEGSGQEGYEMDVELF